MKAVVTTDWHPDVSTLGVSRFDEVRSAVSKSIEYAIDHKVDAYFFLGDLADPDSGGETFKAIEMAMGTALLLQDSGIKSFWLRGNHDVCEDGTGASVLSPMAVLEHTKEKADKVIYVIEKPRAIAFGPEHVILGLPFMPVSHSVDIAERARKLWPKDDRKVVVLSHLTVPGIVPGEETTELPRGRDVLYPFEETKNAVLRLQGHYHRKQVFDPNDGGPPLIIPGSLARLTFGDEEHVPSFLEVEF